jgi:hypothetical protein
VRPAGEPSAPEPSLGEPGGDDASDALHARARAFSEAFTRGAPPPESFDGLAADLSRFQAARVPGYARLCRARGVDPARIARAADAPAVPTDAFRLTRVATFPEHATRATFRTSGTTRDVRGRHELRRLDTYDAAALAFGRWALASDLTEPVRVLCLAPPPEEAPDWSLGHMMQLFVAAFGRPAPAHETWLLSEGALDVATLDEVAARALMAGEEALLVLSTAYGLVHLLDALGGAPFRLPPKSRVMQTGGTNGRSREVAPALLRRELAMAFVLPQTSIVAEYGMTELSSQFWETTLRGGPPDVLVEPPWARVVPVDPLTLRPVPDGEVGLARIEDLMNVDSAFAVQTQDLVRRVPPGFQLLGRSPGAPARGCSLAVEEWLGPA